MLQKQPRGLWKGVVKKGFVTLLVAESFFFVGTYYVWSRLNRERDFRLFMLKSYPWVLEGYYSVGERIDSEWRMRKFDFEIWEKEGKLT